MRFIKISVITAFVICVMLGLCAEGMSRENDGIRKNALRLHVKANSDTKADQQLKLAVRDAILAQAGKAFSTATTKEQAKLICEESLEKIEAIAENEMRKRGYSYSAHAQISDKFFTTKDYGEFTFPAGVYTALTVELGSGEGQNWWCVLFPPLCLTDGVFSEEENEKLYDAGFSEKDITVITEKKTEYEIKFKIVEIWEQIKEWLCFN